MSSPTYKQVANDIDLWHEYHDARWRSVVHARQQLRTFAGQVSVPASTPVWVQHFQPQRCLMKVIPERRMTNVVRTMDTKNPIVDQHLSEGETKVAVRRSTVRPIATQVREQHAHFRLMQRQE